MPPQPRRPRRWRLGALALASTLLLACGGGGEADDPFAPAACVSLPAEITWERSDSASSDWSDVLIDARNRIWLAGYADGVIGETNIAPSGDSRAVLRALSPRGQLLWDSARQFDTPGTDVAEALALSPQGTVFAVGRTTGSLDGRANAGQFDTFVAWHDAPLEATPWQRLQTGNERPQHPRRIQLAANGELHVSGFDDEYVPTNHVVAWSDPFALKLRRSGAGGMSVAWQHPFGSVEPDWAEGLATDAAGATYVSGVVGAGAQRGMFVRKLDAEGRALWTARYSAQPVDFIAALQRLPDGSLLMAGSVFGSFRDGPAAGEQDVFVARISPDDGRVLASWQFGSAGAEWLADMKVDAAGRIHLLGETTGSMVPGQAPAGQSDLFMLRLAADGSVLARRQWGTADDEAARRLALDSCGRVVAVGSSTRGTRRAGLLWFWAP